MENEEHTEEEEEEASGEDVLADAEFAPNPDDAVGNTSGEFSSQVGSGIRVELGSEFDPISQLEDITAAAAAAADDDDSLIQVEDEMAGWGKKPDKIENIAEEEAPIESAVEAVEAQQLEPAAAAVDYSDLKTPPPDTGVSAQIVLIVTSLGSSRHQFFSSKRAQHFLDCKGLVYFLIDTNRDVSKVTESKDPDLLSEWSQSGLLQKEAEDPNRLSLPQILIDGVCIGDYTALTDLEEDGDLDWIAARSACPSCLNEKDPMAAKCVHCSASFSSLIPEDFISSAKVQRFCKGQIYVDELPKSHIRRFSEAMASIEVHSTSPTGEAYTYEALFGEQAPEE